MGQQSRAPDPRIARVVEVVDGDTISVRFVSGTRRTLRYIGIDAPQTPATGDEPACFGDRATRANRRLVPVGSRVRVEYDARREDDAGQLLAYVWRAGDRRFVNGELLRGGYARVLTVPPNLRHVERLVRLGREAREARRGLWAACPL